jgi:hypothetical protein
MYKHSSPINRRAFYATIDDQMYIFIIFRQTKNSSKLKIYMNHLMLVSQIQIIKKNFLYSIQI